MSTAETRTRRGRAVPVVAFGLTLAASVALLLAPTVERQESSCGVTGSTARTLPTDQPACVDRVSHVNLLQEEGISVVFVLAVPVVVAGLALALQWTRWSRNAALGAGTVLALLAVLGAASIGLFYLPGAVAFLIGVSRPKGPGPP